MERWEGRGTRQLLPGLPGARTLLDSFLGDSLHLAAANSEFPGDAPLAGSHRMACSHALFRRSSLWWLQWCMRCLALLVAVRVRGAGSAATRLRAVSEGRGPASGSARSRRTDQSYFG